MFTSSPLTFLSFWRRIEEVVYSFSDLPFLDLVMYFWCTFLLLYMQMHSFTRDLTIWSCSFWIFVVDFVDSCFDKLWNSFLWRSFCYWVFLLSYSCCDLVSWDFLLLSHEYVILGSSLQWSCMNYLLIWELSLHNSIHLLILGFERFGIEGSLEGYGFNFLWQFYL